MSRSALAEPVVPEQRDLPAASPGYPRRPGRAGAGRPDTSAKPSKRSTPPA